MSIRQVEEPCPKCGSMYRDGDCCNICKTFAPYKEPADQRFTRAGKAPHGRVWDSVRHKYVKEA